MTLSDYLPILLLTVVVGVFAVFSFVASNILAPRHPTPAKLSPYESGIEPMPMTGSEPFPIRFYVIAMLFIVFDVEAIFVYPWAVLVRQLKGPGLVEMGIFLGVLVLGLVYVWRKGALEWE